MGLAYQLKDDLEDFKGLSDKSTFENPSVLISLLAEKVSVDDKRPMYEALNQTSFQGLQLLIEKYNISEQITDLVKEYLQKIDSCLRNLQNIELKLALHEIVGKTFRDYL
jgi:geranylgeranyl pyrophosphate synthase